MGKKKRMRKLREQKELENKQPEARAIARYVRISAKKLRKVIPAFKGKTVEEALAILKFLPQKAARVWYKLVKSAAANAEHNHGMDTGKLYVYNAYADEGPIMYRIRPVSMGRAYRIRKRLAHGTVVVREK